MTLFLLTFGIMTLAFAGMAVGFVFSSKELKGSCGGIANIPGMGKSNCSCSNPCEKRQKVMQEAQQQEHIIQPLQRL